MTENRYPPGWDEARVRRLLAHYEAQNEEEAVAEDEAMLAEDANEATVTVPRRLVPEVRDLIARFKTA